MNKEITVKTVLVEHERISKRKPLEGNGAIRKKTLINAYAKIEKYITYMYFEDVLNSRKNKSLRGKTLYKITRPLLFHEFISNVSRNKKTDISKAAIINM